MVSPQAKREAVNALVSERGFGVTRACGLIRLSRSLYRYRSVRVPCAALRERIEQIAADKRRYGYRRVYLRLRREGWGVNRKRVYRLYRDAAWRCGVASESASASSSASLCRSRS